MIVLLDTNFLLLPHTHKIDIFTRIEQLIDNPEFVILSGTIGELEKIAAGRGNDAVAATVGIKLIEKNNIKIEESVGLVDDAIIHYASENNTLVCSNDKALKRKLTSLRVPIITLLGMDKLVRI